MTTTRTGTRAGLGGFRSQLAVGTAFASLFAGYGGRAVLAGDCTVDGAAGTYLCTGAANAATDHQQSFSSGTPLTVTTDPGFGLTVGNGSGFVLSSSGGATFDDGNHNSPISASGSATAKGIYVRNTDSGDVTITATGSVSSVFRGVDSQNAGSGSGATTITVGQVTASSATGVGVIARTGGNGPVSVTATGAVNAGYGGVGVLSLGSSATPQDQTDVDIHVTSVTTTGPDSTGIVAYNFHSGGVNVSATGPVSGAQGINVVNHGAGLSIDAGDVTGQGTNRGAISAYKSGGGDMTISAGQVTAAHEYGVYANNDAGGDLTVSVAGASENSTTGFGIKARNNGTGIVSVSSTGLVSGGTGIDARSTNATKNDVTVDVQDVNAAGGGSSLYSQGIFADGRNVAVTARDVYTQQGYNAIAAYGQRVTVETRDVTGADNGIFVFSAANADPGATSSVTVTGTARGGDRNGVYAKAYGSAAALDVTVNNAYGGLSGIKALNSLFSTGDLNITTTGTVTGGTGISAATGDGPGDISITVSGAVTGSGGNGIATSSGAGATTTIALNAGAAVSTTGGHAILNDVGDSHTTVNSGASVTGSIALGDGADSLTFDGGDFSGVTQFDGGAGTGDSLTFRHVTGNLDGDKAINWETVAIGTGGKISVSNALNADLVTVSDGGKLGGNGTINGALIAQLGGTVSPGNSPGELTVTGDFTLDPGATLQMEVNGINPGEFDTLSVGGDLFLNSDVVFQTAESVANQTFIDQFLVFDFIFGPSSDFNIASFTGADYFLKTVTATFDLFLQQDGSFQLGQAVGPGYGVPEPGTLGLLGAGLFGLFGFGRARRRKRHSGSTESRTGGSLRGA